MIHAVDERKLDRVLIPEENGQENPNQAPRLFAWLKRELIVFASLSFIGFVFVPMSIYVVGKRILGDYGNGGVMKDFYVDLYSRFAAFEPGAWMLLLGPWLFITFVRFLYLPLSWKRRPESPATGA